MKLRLKDNSIRLRLSQSEVDAFAVEGAVFKTTAFPGDSHLNYGIQAFDADQLQVEFSDSMITIQIPKERALVWARTDEVGITYKVRCQNGDELDVIVEKDFRCLTLRVGEDESDLFPNPGKQHSL